MQRADSFARTEFDELLRAVRLTLADAETDDSIELLCEYEWGQALEAWDESKDSYDAVLMRWSVQPLGQVASFACGTHRVLVRNAERGEKVRSIGKDGRRGARYLVLVEHRPVIGRTYPFFHGNTEAETMYFDGLGDPFATLRIG